MPEYESMTKVVSAKGHADGLQNMPSMKRRQTSEWDKERCVMVVVVPVPGSNPQEGSTAVTEISTRLSLYVQHTHAPAGWMYLNTMSHVCSVVPFPSVTHMLQTCK